MFVGATGAGKSTLIDGLINYILDVAWEDESSFKLINLTPEEEKKRNEVCQIMMTLEGCRTIISLMHATNFVFETQTQQNVTGSFFSVYCN